MICRRFVSRCLVCVLLLVSCVPSVSAGDDLYLTWVGIVDNLEGDGGLHGPSGSFHLDIYAQDGRHLARHHLGKEILDGDELNLDVPLGTLGLDADRLRIKIWESDPMAADTFGKFVPLHKIGEGLGIGSDWSGALGRKHDVAVDLWLTGPGVYASPRPARPDAVQNVQAKSPSWLDDVWSDCICQGIPTMFFQIEARPSAFDRPDASARSIDDAVAFDPDDVFIGDE